MCVGATDPLSSLRLEPGAPSGARQQGVEVSLRDEGRNGSAEVLQS